jgi:2-oxoglutarate ferredoxin oxidoreductase subunit beta
LGLIEAPVNPLALALTSGVTFVAQGFAGDLNHLVLILKEAITHKGFSLVNVLQPCVTFNKVNTYQYYLQRVYKLDKDYQKDNFKLALDKALEVNEEKFPLGVIYQVKRPCYHESLPQTSSLPLVEKKRFLEYDSLIKEFI